MRSVLMNAQRAHAVYGQVGGVHPPASSGNNQPAHRVSFEPLTMTPWPNIEPYRSKAAPPSADERQGAYFIAMLSQHLRRIDSRIDKCLNAIADAKAAGDVGNFRGFRQLLEIEQQERRAVEQLLEKLCRRFRPPVGGEDR